MATKKTGAPAKPGKDVPRDKIDWARGGDGKKPIKKPTKPGDAIDPGYGKPVIGGDYEQYLEGEDRDAFLFITSLFKSYGLESLSKKIFEYVKNGYGADTIQILLQDTPEYKQRFAGNEERKKRGLPVLSPAEYLSAESSIQSAFRAAGLPTGFYDSPNDFADFIGKNVSPTELQSRVELASQATALAAPSYREALKKLYGIDEKLLTAYFLDPNKALPLLQKQAAAATIGAEAQKRGFYSSAAKLEEYAAQGVTQQAAAQAFEATRNILPQFSTIAHSYGEEITGEEISESLLGVQPSKGKPGESSTAKFERLKSWQRARAQGAIGGGQVGLTRRSTPG